MCENQISDRVKYLQMSDRIEMLKIENESLRNETDFYKQFLQEKENQMAMAYQQYHSSNSNAEIIIASTKNILFFYNKSLYQFFNP